MQEDALYDETTNQGPMLRVHDGIGASDGFRLYVINTEYTYQCHANLCARAGDLGLALDYGKATANRRAIVLLTTVSSTNLSLGSSDVIGRALRGSLRDVAMFTARVSLMMLKESLSRIHECGGRYMASSAVSPYSLRNGVEGLHVPGFTPRERARDALARATGDYLVYLFQVWRQSSQLSPLAHRFDAGLRELEQYWPGIVAALLPYRELCRALSGTRSEAQGRNGERYVVMLPEEAELIETFWRDYAER